MGLDLDRMQSRRKLILAARKASVHLPPALPPVLFMTDPVRTPDPLNTVSALPVGWGVVLRHFGRRDLLALAPRLSETCRQNGLRFLIANDPKLAAEVGAHGVHWPEASVQKAKFWRGRFAIMTAAAHSSRALESARRAGCNAALLSCAFASKSPTATPPLGTTRFTAIARRARLPVYALGGVNAANAHGIADVAGLASVEGVSSVFGTRASRSQMESERRFKSLF